MSSKVYSQSYENSYALVIGINQYLHASPLEYAVNDAKEIAATLQTQFHFPEKNIQVLLDNQATKSNIITAFLAYAGTNTSDNDKVLIFFAGHGMTQTGQRGEVGFLVPYDGDGANLATLIRWDDLTRNAELIPAKHILFIMDACYGGLAITRALASGSMRFLKDMIQRYSRQVLTAGKADEVVSDSGGPILGHSVFTGHLLQGLQGKAETAEGVISANSIMAYVYNMVAKDIHSQQTPHYGFLDGDGDFIFKGPNIDGFSKSSTKDNDIFISVPVLLPETDMTMINNVIEKTKEYLSERKNKIKLFDLVNQNIRETVDLLSDEKFSEQGNRFSNDEFINRMKMYEEIVKETQLIAACIAQWGEEDHSILLSKIISRLSDTAISNGGLVVWIALKWYPIMLLVYHAGISSISADNYGALAAICTTKVQSPRNPHGRINIISQIGDFVADLHDAFKILPGHERNYVPRSEYLFKLIQPGLDDLLFLGREYEVLFDRFEIFLALVYADLKFNPEEQIWGPLGRFAWKYRSRSDSGNVFREIVDEAKMFQSDWKPLKYGLFSGSVARFLELATKFENDLLKKLNWH